MTNDLRDPLDDQEVERRLRVMFSEVMPLLDAPPAAAEADSTETTVVPLRARPAAARRGTGRRVVAVLTAAAAIVGLVALVRHPIADGPTDASTRLPAAPPTWYGIIHPFLPDGFDQIALLNASAESVNFVAWRPATGQHLDIVIGLRSGDLKAPGDTVTGSDEYGTWYESTSGVALATVDGRLVSLSCGVSGLLGGAVGSVGLIDTTRDHCGEGIDNLGIGAASRRELVATLATKFPLDVVGEAFGQPVLNETFTPLTADAISAVRSGRAFEGWDAVGFFGVVTGANLSPLGDVSTSELTVINGVYPAGPDPSVPSMAMERMADPRSRFTHFGDVAVAWMVTADGVGFQIATTDLSDGNLLRLGGLIENVALQPTESAVATTLPGSPSTSTTDPGRELGDADRIAAVQQISALFPDGFDRLQISPTLTSLQAFDAAGQVITASYRVTPEQLDVGCATSTGGNCPLSGSLSLLAVGTLTNHLMPLFQDAATGDELSVLATLREMTPPQEVSVDAAAAEALFREVVGATVIEFLAPVTGVAASNIDDAMALNTGDGSTVWVSIVSSSGVMFRARVGIPSTGDPIAAMQQLAGVPPWTGTEVAATEP